jgi:hypothetical protein
VPELPERLGLDLADALAGDVELLADFLERVAAMHENDRITPEHVGRLLASPDGLMKSTEGRRVVPVINMVDDAAREAQAREAAAIALRLTDRFDRVVLACLARAEDPLVGVVRR